MRMTSKEDNTSTPALAARFPDGDRTEATAAAIRARGEQATPPPTPARGRGCLFRSFLTVLVVLLVLVASAGVLLARLPAQLGIWPSGSSLLAGTPDRTGAAAILDELRADNIDTTGITLYVLPVAGEDSTLAYAVLDTRAGFHFPASVPGGPASLPNLFARLADGTAVTDARVAQVAIEYRDPSGQTLGVLTASVANIHAFVTGTIDQATFSNDLDGNFDPGAALNFLLGGSTP
jgi:hypothetical protein